MAAPNPIPATVTWEQLQQQLGLTIPHEASAKRQATTTSMPGATLQELMRTVCKDGERTQHLTQLIGSLLATGFGLEESIENCRRWNQLNTPPLEDDKIVSTCESIHTSDQRNHPERYADPLQHEPLFDLDAGRVGHYLDKAPPPRKWLFEELVVLGRVGAIVAPGGSSKSQLMIQMGVSVATGIPVAGHWEVGETGGVIIFFAEDDDDEIHRRLHRVQNHLTMAGHGKELQPLRERLFIFSTIGTDTLLPRKERPARCRPRLSWTAWQHWRTRCLICGSSSLTRAHAFAVAKKTRTRTPHASSRLWRSWRSRPVQLSCWPITPASSVPAATM